MKIARALMGLALVVTSVSCGSDDSSSGAGGGTEEGDESSSPFFPPEDLEDAGPINPIGEKPDAGEPEADTDDPGSDFGEPCSENTDCDSGWCVDSYDEKLCSQICEENCPPGWVCSEVSTPPDIVFICIPALQDLCEPCSSPTSCGGSPDLCLEDSSSPTGSSCAISCGEGLECPSGFSCDDTEDGSFCLPTSGDCSCVPTTQGETRSCDVSNEVGTCVGQQVCDVATGWSACSALAATPEVCNGVDDDCDGEVDEDASTAGCVVRNEWGSCAGQLSCEGGQGEVCDAPAPLPEACNGVDDNCDGALDEEGALGCVETYVDADEDGVGDSAQAACLCEPAFPFVTTVGGDCNDDDAAVGALGEVESCTAPGEEPADEDCDGMTDEADAEGCAVYFADSDTDEFGALGDSLCLCAPTGDYTAAVGGDCDDTNPDANPAQAEACNGFDDDCNGDTDEEGAVGCTDYWADFDQDEFGAEGDPVCLCGPEIPYTADNTADCNDTNSAVSPADPESCDGVDNNCDGVTDEDGAEGCTSYFVDGDLDEFGAEVSEQCTCGDPPAGTVAIGGDCNDGESSINPDAAEVCNGEDDDCDGETDEADADGCTTWYADVDGDDFGVETDAACLCAPAGDYTATVGGDCNDGLESINPGATESCGGEDENCDGATDEEGADGCVDYFVDGDGDEIGLTPSGLCLCGPDFPNIVTVGGDCDDEDASVGPGGDEICNGADDDCDGETDEPGAVGCFDYYQDSDEDDFGDGSAVACLCVADALYTTPWPGDCDDDDPLVYPGALEPCETAADCCEDGWQCVFGVCLDETPPCGDSGDCQGDTYCEDGACIPYEVGPADTLDACVKAPKVGIFNPAIQCSWPGPPPGDAFPDHAQVLGTPMVADFDLDSDPDTLRPAIVFVSYSGTDGGFPAASSNGVIRVLDGSTCEQLYTLDTLVVGAAPVAIADLDLEADGRPEIVAFRQGGGMVAFKFSPAAAAFQIYFTSTEPTGASSTLASSAYRWNGPTVADLTGDAHPEILMGSVVHTYQGLIIANNLGYKQLAGTSTGGFDVVADVDLDGEMELVTGDGVWRYDGDASSGAWVKESYYTAAGNPNHFVAVGDFGDFPVAGLPADIPEIVMVGGGQARVVALNGSTIFGPIELPTFTPGTPGFGGPPTIGDFDGDGQAEFAAAGYGAYTVFDFSCLGAIPPLGCLSNGVLWTRQSQDQSSNRTGSSVFDFEADGIAEAVYADECYTRVYDGLTGEVLYSQSRTSCTWYENPIIVDVDGDLRSEVVIGSNTNCGVGCAPIDPIHRGLRCDEDLDCPPGGACSVGYCRCTDDAACGDGSGYVCTAPLPNTPGLGNVCRAGHQGPEKGIRVYRDFADGWVNSRPIWNQHAYSITDITESGQVVPRADVEPNWTVPGLNNFRQNSQGGGDPTLAADITVDPGVLLNCDPAGTLDIPVEVCNRGEAPVDLGIPVAFFTGVDATVGDVLCLEFTTTVLQPTECEAIACTISPAPGESVDITVSADFGGSQGQSSECLESNNFASFGDVTCDNL